MVNLTLKEDQFGVMNGQPIRRFTWRHKGGLTVSVINYGATITDIKFPDRNGKVQDLNLGFDSIDGYLGKDNPYFGATVGRCANRIAKGRFEINGHKYQVAQNIGENHLHGGFVGFDKKMWDVKIEGFKVIFTYKSRDGEESYPGELTTDVTYEVTPDNSILVNFRSTTDKATVVNLTNHAYLNLAGHEAGAEGLYEHCVTINADCLTAVDSESIPTGELSSVAGTPFDFRKITNLGSAMSKAPEGGFDHNFCISPQDTSEDLHFVAKVVHPKSGRALEVFSNQPGVQFYTSNGLPDGNNLGVLGKDGARYNKHGAFCLETQNYPDAVNHSTFPKAILEPGQVYSHSVKYFFYAVDDEFFNAPPKVTSI